MGRGIDQPSIGGVWRRAREQHGVITRVQLRELGYTDAMVDHRLVSGRLHPLWRGVFAVGRPDLAQDGYRLAAVLACGRGARLSHGSAGGVWEIEADPVGSIEVSIPSSRRVRLPGITIYRRSTTPERVARVRGIPVTSPACTLLDLATRLSPKRLERAISEADKRNLIGPDDLWIELSNGRGRPGVRALRAVLERHAVVLTESELERLFLPLIERAGLPVPVTQQLVNGYRVDFFWPELGLVVETDGLTYHRTPAQQARDRKRDQAHTRAGMTVLRFTYAQVVREFDEVRETLGAVAARLSRNRPKVGLFAGADGAK